MYSSQNAVNCKVCIARRDKDQIKADLALRKIEREVEARNRAAKKKKQYVQRVKRRDRGEAAESDALAATAANPNLTPEQRELANRALCKRHLLPFTKRFVPGYDAGWVHIDICERLEKFYQDVVDKKDPRLMLFMPPRAGKSELASTNFPAWVFGQDPSFQFIATSYAAALATDFSRKVRDRIKLDPKYHAIFPETRVDKKQENVERWATTKGGTYVAAGVEGPISGRGGRICLIDDPIKNRADADSTTIQDGIWNWYTSTFLTRVEPGGGILIIQTRWSDMDVSSKLIEMMEADPDADQFEIITYPALAEEDEYIDLESREIVRSPSASQFKELDLRLLRKKDEALHPARYNEKVLASRRVMMGTRDWSALMQQRPMPSEGEFFKDDWIKRKSVDPAAFSGMKHIIAADLAIGSKDYHHKTAIVVGAKDYNGHLYIRDMIVGKMSAHEIVEKILDLYQYYDAFMCGIENGGLKLALQDQFNLRIQQRQIFPTFDDTLTPVTDKEVRARPFQGLLQAGYVFWPEHEPWWYSMAMYQLLAFPAAGDGKDDIVDALAWLGRMYHNVSPPRKPVVQNPRHIPWKKRLKLDAKAGRSAMSA